MVYDAGMLVMILIPGVAAYRRGERSELAKTVYRDGAIYYVYIFLCSMLNVVVTLVLSPELIYILTAFERVLHSVLASRAFLHIRQVALQLATFRTISDIQFTQNGRLDQFCPEPSSRSIEMSGVNRNTTA
ncbi:hypothetical protein L218DRAFT_304691 [Marasmius fiardii PR-910]|nr:hypothetical protein L218DRAFT_304691 [Marasmius fiardii PR-910]